MKRTAQDILKKDKALYREVSDIMASGGNLPVARRAGISRNAITKAMVGPHNELPRAEAMILRHLRPALLVRKNKIETPESPEIRKRLVPYLPKLEARVPSIGRIDFVNLGKPFGGTGWMITEDIIVTNRHVALEFAEKRGRSIAFRRNALGAQVEAYIDFKEEYAGDNRPRPEFEIAVEKVLYITAEKPSEPDIAFLRIKRHHRMPPPIPISDVVLKKDQFISVIGYPAYDPDGIISNSAAHSVFNNIYEVKRCSPGEVVEYEKRPWYFFHDCTTLGGNSGSVVLDNLSGAAVGLHFMGEVQKENYAVKASEVLKHLRKVSTKVFISQPVEKKAPPKGGPKLEAPPASYNDRMGYRPGFLGSKFKVPLPTVVKNKTDVLKFSLNGKSEQELRYQHFSVVMNKERRLCFFSACNIDGELSKRGVKRSGWKYDSRIPEKYQVKEECYGNPPLFSRGHMTRKEDPIWGDLPLARVAAADSFHVTNAVPQMQPFNAPVWLELEDYALENARQDDMRITVITGPIFRKDDPEREGVQIPVEFFKIIAFVHDETGKLCATGYSVSQEDYLSNEEFVFGQFSTYQRSIKSIERLTGLKFGNLASVDPIRGEEAVATPLAVVGEVRFI